MNHESKCDVCNNVAKTWELHDEYKSACVKRICNGCQKLIYATWLSPHSLQRLESYEVKLNITQMAIDVLNPRNCKQCIGVKELK